MTGGAARVQRAIEQLEPLVKGLQSKSVLDIGCGTGTDSLALAKLGCLVMGVDASPEMIARARLSVASAYPLVKFEVDDVTKLDTVPEGWADLAICRGNLLPHILTTDDLRKSIAALARVTKKGGILALGWLNYIPILKSRNRLIGLSGDEKQVFLRFNDFNDDGSLDFNIVSQTFDEQTKKWKAEWQTTRLTPWQADDVGMMLAANGWEELEIGSSLNRDDFDPDSSRDVFIFAVRGESR